jgi:predicted Rossmann-fold nucleotide-binding protein
MDSHSVAAALGGSDRGDLVAIRSPCAVAAAHQLVIVAGGGRQLAWPVARIAVHLLQISAGRSVRALLHGAARGADQSIAAAADQLGWPVIACPALWQQHGRAAGPIRNRQMLHRAIALLAAAPAGAALQVVAFPGGAGTASLIHHTRALMARSSLPIALRAIHA